MFASVREEGDQGGLIRQGDAQQQAEKSAGSPAKLGPLPLEQQQRDAAPSQGVEQRGQQLEQQSSFRGEYHVRQGVVGPWSVQVVLFDGTIFSRQLGAPYSLCSMTSHPSVSSVYLTCFA
jgi:hypothetical protein